MRACQGEIYRVQLEIVGAGFQCLTGTTPACASTDCGQAPVVALAYVVCNLGLNISALALLRKAGAQHDSTRNHNSYPHA